MGHPVRNNKSAFMMIGAKEQTPKIITLYMNLIRLCM